MQKQNQYLFNYPQNQSSSDSCSSGESWNHYKIPKQYLTHSKIQTFKKNIQAKSIYHNSQKHAITTLKNMVSVAMLKNTNQAQSQAKKIWHLFLKSKGKNKQILTIIYGSPTTIEDEVKMKKRFVQYGFQKLNEDDYKIIVRAQTILRQLTIMQINQNSLESHIKSRKMTSKQCFKHYMLNLVQQLKQGPIKRRLPKNKSMEISNLFDVDKYINLGNFERKFQQIQMVDHRDH